MELTKGMQMGLQMAVKMLLPPDVMKVITPERAEALVSSIETAVNESREATKQMLVNDVARQATLEAMQDEIASLTALLSERSSNAQPSQRQRRSGNSGSSSNGSGNSGRSADGGNAGE